MCDVCPKKEPTSPCIIVCGGLSPLDDPFRVEKVSACVKSACDGYEKLLNKNSAIDAVETALWWLENDELFNCGYGSLLNGEGNVEMEACLVDGFNMQCGSVVTLRDVEHPITLARHVLTNYPNKIFSNELAKKLTTVSAGTWISSGNMIAPRTRDDQQPSSTMIINNSKLI